ncbi:MAG: transglycosylase SLT domain-containing protein [Deltaproteobacteria bacterium]|nr:transglycosylase SLT domain-containing protein [Deltaproteobacteria bacterium]
MIGRRERLKNIFFAILLFTCLVVVSAVHAGSDIYKYIDSNGVLHFTNVPVACDYRMYVWKGALPAWSTDQFDNLIHMAAMEHDVPFPLLKALMKAESNFDPYATSRAGAQGLMQIMPATACELGISRPFDAGESINGGARYLRKLLTMFDNKVPLALAAYNAGPGTVSRFNRIPPIRETQEFVRRVMNYYQAFKEDQYAPLTQ